MNRTATLTATAAVLALAACSSSAHTNSIAAPTASAPSATANSLPPDVTLSSGGQKLPPGPFQITPLSCGPYTALQRSQFGTSAAGGLSYSYTNTSNSLTSAPSLSVNFTLGTNVIGHNVTGDLIQTGPGQTAQGTVDALTASGGNLGGYNCEVMGYSLGYSPTVSFAP